MLIPVIAICLLLIGTHDSRSAILELVPTPVLLHDQAQQDAPLRPMYIRFHPRFYKEYGEAGLSSTLYLQNPNQMPGNYVLEFYDCVSGTLVFPPAPPIWVISPGVTRVAGPDDLPDLPPGCYGLVVTSDTDLAHASLVEDTWNGGPATDKLAAHSGVAREEAVATLRFGPLLKGEVNAKAHIWNTTNYASATLTVSAYDAAGKQITLPPCTAAPMAQCTYDTLTLTQLPSSFVGTLVVQSIGGSVMGLMSLDSTSGDFNEYRKPLKAGAPEVCLPRVLKQVKEVGVARTTILFVANSASQTAGVNLVFYDGAGTPVAAASQSFNLASNGSRYLNLKDLDTLPDGAWAVCATGGQSLALSVLRSRWDIGLYRLGRLATEGMDALEPGRST